MSWTRHRRSASWRDRPRLLAQQQGRCRLPGRQSSPGSTRSATCACRSAAGDDSVARPVGGAVLQGRRRRDAVRSREQRGRGIAGRTVSRCCPSPLGALRQIVARRFVPLRGNLVRHQQHLQLGARLPAQGAKRTSRPGSRCRGTAPRGTSWSSSRSLDRRRRPPALWASEAVITAPLRPMQSPFDGCHQQAADVEPNCLSSSRMPVGLVTLISVT